MKKNKNKMILGLIILFTLVVSFWYGGNAPGLRGFDPKPDTTENIETETGNEDPGEFPHVEEQSKEIEQTNKEIKEKLAKANEEIEEKLDQADKKVTEKENNSQQARKDEKTTTRQENPGKNQSSSSGTKQEAKDYSEDQGMEINPETGKDKYATDPVPDGKPVPVEPGNKPVTNKKKTATLSVRVDTLLNNLEVLPSNKV
ncbi:MAG: hypothetical protein L0J75_06500, partial [Alkalibacterium sp.]|nr:hypothetical protein [Alkalibacterium sp.]